MLIDLQLPFPGILRLHQIAGGTFGQHEASFHLGAYDLLDTTTAVPAGSSVHVIAYLTSKGLMNPTTNRLIKGDGTIERLGDDWPVVHWQVDSQKYSLLMVHGSQQVSLRSGYGLLLNQRPCLTLTLQLENSTDTPSLLNRVEESLELPILLFSLLSRRTIRWFNLVITVQVDDTPTWVEAQRRARATSPEPDDRDERPMFSEHDLATGAFANLLFALADNSLLADLSRAIRYHLSSYRLDTIDTRFLLAFAAFETLLKAVDSATPFSAAEEPHWATLSHWLERVVTRHARVHKIEQGAVNAIRSKLGNLNSPGFMRKALHHIDRLGVDTSGLWLNYTTAEDEFRKGFERAYKQRNSLVHNTSIADLGDLLSDLARLQCLFERVIARLLGWPSPAISEALARARWVAQRSPKGI